ncbi:hypothetical protein SUDANB121_00724 [Nocardiopsis dassonvillei]|uniref:DUF2306 domain-containing protein n=1 Tax=Nocardiopsis dassonvillei TaxID=2014 RepID=UPI003F552C86
MTPSARREWPVPVLLILLSAVPVIAGGVRLGDLGGGGPVTPDNARFFADPVPVVLHIVAAVPYCLLGTLQFAPRLRRRRWHRAAGRVLVPLGLVAALTGLWMSLSYPLNEGENVSLTLVRLVFGSAMAAAILVGFAAVRRGDITGHRAWMIRGYAIGQGAGTQVFTHLPWTVFLGEPGEAARTGLMAAGWLINLAVAEWAIRRSTARPGTRAVRAGTR